MSADPKTLALSRVQAVIESLARATRNLDALAAESEETLLHIPPSLANKLNERMHSVRIAWSELCAATNRAGLRWACEVVNPKTDQ
jgi:hypothetical protein